MYCYSDLWPHNFMVDDAGQAYVVDFAFASFLPSSFSKMALRARRHKIGCDLSDQVTTPVTEGVDNTLALCDAAAAMVMASGMFHKMGRSLFGDAPEYTLMEEEEKTWTPRPLLDDQGRQLEVTLNFPESMRRKAPSRTGPPPIPPAGWKGVLSLPIDPRASN